MKKFGPYFLLVPPLPQSLPFAFLLACIFSDRDSRNAGDADDALGSMFTRCVTGITKSVEYTASSQSP